MRSVLNVLDTLDFPAVATPDSRRAHLSASEAGTLLGLSRQRVGFYVRRGDLPATIINGDYILQRQDVLHFKEQRESGKRRTKAGRPGPAEMAARRQERELAKRRREQLDELRRQRVPAAVGD